ncbi:MAG: enoyl-CoA hydratase/isomerase family protein [Candidatus Hodarchaeales archaeon]
MAYIKTEIKKYIAIIKLNRGVTNAINLDLVNQMIEKLNAIRNDKDIRSVVLTGSNNKFFAIGFDIPELIKLSEKDFREFFVSFNQLSLDIFSFPKPIIAAITGHAVAGGCILALCCDYRFIAAGHKLMGLNEVKLGVPLPYPVSFILQDLAGTRYSRDIAYTGEYYGPEDLFKMGLVDGIFPLEQVMEKAIEKAALLGSMPGDAFWLIKRDRIYDTRNKIIDDLDKKEDEFINRWFSEEAREQLEEASKKF